MEPLHDTFIKLWRLFYYIPWIRIDRQEEMSRFQQLGDSRGWLWQWAFESPISRFFDGIVPPKFFGVSESPEFLNSPRDTCIWGECRWVGLPTPFKCVEIIIKAAEGTSLVGGLEIFMQWLRESNLLLKYPGWGRGMWTLFAMEMSDLGVQIRLDISWENLGQDLGASSSYPTCFNLVWFFFLKRVFELCHLKSMEIKI